jgi:LPXTG-site transpeptidase (sortase) family protein
MTYVHRFANAFTRRLSNVFMLFGLALFLVGAGVVASRETRLAVDVRASQAPSFAMSLGTARPGRIAVATAVVTATRTVTAAVAAASEPDRIVIPAIGVDVPVVEVGWEARVVNGANAGNEWVTASFAAGFHRGSALPGQAGNTVISGHNNIDGAVFKDLHQLKPYDWIFLYASGRRLAYFVEERFIVPEQNATEKQHLDNVKWISETPDERLTLVTCYPPWSNTHRTIVLARPMHDVTQIPPDAPPP